jgi:hypothetical protein
MVNPRPIVTHLPETWAWPGACCISIRWRLFSHLKHQRTEAVDAGVMAREPLVRRLRSHEERRRSW